MSSEALRVVVADDSFLLRAGVVRVLEATGFDVVGEAADADELLDQVREHRPDVVVTDIRMPPTNTDEGLRAAAEIRAELPGTGVLVLSQFANQRYALQLLGESAAGVGYLLKDRVMEPRGFADAVREVARGGSALDPEVVARMLDGRSPGGPIDDAHRASARCWREWPRAGRTARSRSTWAQRAHARARPDAHLRQARAARRQRGPSPRASRPHVPPRAVTVRVVTWAERPELADRGPASEQVWPEYNLHGDVFDELVGAAGRRAAGVPVRALRRGGRRRAGRGPHRAAGVGRRRRDAAGRDRRRRSRRRSAPARGRPADTLCAIAAEVAPDARRGGRAGRAAGRDALDRPAVTVCAALIAPVRPSWKERYPLAPIERYVTWRRDDGQLLDPWMRLHERLGARVAAPLPRSMRDHRHGRGVGALDRPALPESGATCSRTAWRR